jgi:hypothetical protein
MARIELSLVAVVVTMPILSSLRLDDLEVGETCHQPLLAVALELDRQLDIVLELSYFGDKTRPELRVKDALGDLELRQNVHRLV